MDIEFKLFDPNGITREDWNKIHEYRMERHHENPDDSILSDEVYEKAILQDYKNDSIYIRRYLIIDSQKSKQIGYMTILASSEKDPSYEMNKSLLYFNLAILKDFRKKGIATKSMEYLLDFAKKHNSMLAQTRSSEEDGFKFLKKIGANLARSEKEARLQMKDVDWDMIKRWVSEAKLLNPNTKIVRFTRVPDEIIDQYSKVCTETFNQMPMDNLEQNAMIITPEFLRNNEKEFNELGSTINSLITVEQDNQISAMTEMVYNPEKKTMISQHLTGVRNKYRGRKLGKWIKGLMLLDMKEKYPEVTIATTTTADSNASMLSINNRLGYKPFKESVTAQIKLDDLEKYYSSKAHLAHQS